jgi:hypothetical protein
MPSNELAFEVTSQELMDPKTALPEPIEFDDLDTVLQPAVLSANESAPASIEDVDVELELEADDIDALLGASGKLSA